MIEIFNNTEATTMKDKTIYDEASEVDAEDGIVSIKGLTPWTSALTPEAAEETRSASTPAP